MWTLYIFHTAVGFQCFDSTSSNILPLYNCWVPLGTIHVPPNPRHATCTSIRKNCIQGARTSGGKASRLVPPAVLPRCDVDPHCHTYGSMQELVRRGTSDVKHSMQ